MQSKTIEHFWGPPPDALKLCQGEVHVWAASLDQPSAHQFSLAGILSIEERLKASRLVIPGDRARAVAARGFLRQILASYLQCEAASIEFEYNPNGKPSLVRGQSGPRFNLSHSNALFVCAVSSQSEVGIDVEQVGGMPDSDASAIVERFFSEIEKSAYRTSKDDQKQLAFYRLWTRKEAIAKCSGQGIAEERPPQTFDGVIIDLTPAAGYIGSLAVETPSCTLQTWCWVE
jgi:4'-phosphopantetheinyl transferase